MEVDLPDTVRALEYGPVLDVLYCTEYPVIVSPVSTVGALHVTLNTPRCGSGVTLMLPGGGGSVGMIE